MSEQNENILMDATAEAIFSKLEKDESTETKPFEFEGQRFHIKKLSVLDVLNIQAKSVHEYGGKTIQLLSESQRKEVLYTLHYGVVKGPDNLEPLFTITQIESLMKNAKANTLLDALTLAILTWGEDSKNS